MLRVFRSFAAYGFGAAAGLFACACGTAGEPVRQTFETWTITIQPGSAGIGVKDVQARPNPIRLAAQVTEQGQAGEQEVDESELPPSPHNGHQAQRPASDVVRDEAGPLVIVGNAPCAGVDGASLVKRYTQVYNAIPFSRAEYEANPGYRHEATMEFLFGQLRPTVIHRGTTTIRMTGSALLPGAAPYGPAFGPGAWNSYYAPYLSTPYALPYYNGVYRPYSLW